MWCVNQVLRYEQWIQQFHSLPSQTVIFKYKYLLFKTSTMFCRCVILPLIFILDLNTYSENLHKISYLYARWAFVFTELCGILVPIQITVTQWQFIFIIILTRWCWYKEKDIPMNEGCFLFQEYKICHISVTTSKYWRANLSKINHQWIFENGSKHSLLLLTGLIKCSQIYR